MMFEFRALLCVRLCSNFDGRSQNKMPAHSRAQLHFFLEYFARFLLTECNSINNGSIESNMQICRIFFLISLLHLLFSQDNQSIEIHKVRGSKQCERQANGTHTHTQPEM